MVVIKLVATNDELLGIKQLQNDNLKQQLTDAEAADQGFVTATYTLEFLQLMHQLSPSIIAKDGDTVVGYALVATKEIRQQHQLLGYLFDAIDTLHYKGHALKAINYVVVGQLCVAKNYRGQGLPQQLYQFFKTSLQQQYSCCITDVVQANQRSLKAHLKTGFVVIDTLVYDGVAWDIVLWDWGI